MKSEKTTQKKSADLPAKANPTSVELTPAVISKAAEPASVAPPAAKPAVPTKVLAKRRVKITVSSAKPRAGATKKAAKPADALAVKPGPKPKLARVTAKKSSKPGAQRQLIKKPRARKAAPAVPPILLEGDGPSRSTLSGPGARYALGPAAPPAHAARFDEPGELPDAYGTQRLTLTARDPHWLYAHWDFTGEQLKKFNALSMDGHLILRVFAGEVSGEPAVTQHVHPESRHWFVFVGRGGTKFSAELGYRSAGKKWVQLAASRPTLTPPDSLSEDTSVRFANLPVEVPFDQILDVVKAAMSENIPLLEAIQQLRAEGYTKLPPAEVFAAASTPALTPEQEKALAEIVTMDAVRRVWIGSLEITELVKRQLAKEISAEISSAVAAQFSAQAGLPSSPLGAISSPSQRPGARARGFWFNINAELVIYGATEPDAAVTIGGRNIRLRPDGTFSYRFALPDGQFPLPVSAHSADGVEARAAELHFSRVTHFHGDVPAHPQDASLKPPVAASVA